MPTNLTVAIAVLVGLVILLVIFVAKGRQSDRYLRQQSCGVARRHGSVPVPPSEVPGSVRSEISALVSANQKIAAIKLLREHSGLSLVDAKLAVDQWDVSAHDTRISVVQPITSESAKQLLSDVQRAEIDRLVSERKLIEAIKKVREFTGLGLKEAKFVVDHWGGLGAN